jgi:hypothetical protein
MAGRTGGRTASEIALLCGVFVGFGGGGGSLALGALGVFGAEDPGDAEPYPVATENPGDSENPSQTGAPVPPVPSADGPADVGPVPVVLLAVGLLCLAILIVLTVIRRRERT